MPGGSDYNRQRPPRRKSWQDSDESADPFYNAAGKFAEKKQEIPNEQIEDDPESYSSGFSRNVRMPGDTSQSKRAQNLRIPKPTAKGRLPRRYEEDDGDEADNKNSAVSSKKAKRKKLYKLLGAEALCLGILFGLIGAFNWMAGDFSGDYMGRGRELGQIRLSLARLDSARAKAGLKDEMEVEMEYGRHGLLSLRPGEHVAVPAGDESFTLKMVSTSKVKRIFIKPWLATFTGHIEDGKVSGTIADTTGAYKISLEKNLMTSLFRKTQDHIPTAPSVPLPSLFDEHARAPRRNDFSGGQFPRPRGSDSSILAPAAVPAAVPAVAPRPNN
jgi:hypothetical protein